MARWLERLSVPSLPCLRYKSQTENGHSIGHSPRDMDSHLPICHGEPKFFFGTFAARPKSPLVRMARNQGLWGITRRSRHADPPRTGHYLTAAIDVQKTKLALVYTCREWNVIATPLLYEHVAISRARQCQMVIQWFTTGPAGNSKRGRQDLVSRLDIFSAPTLQKAAMLCGLFPRLHSLLAVVHREENADPNTLFDAFPSCLKHVFWITTGLPSGDTPPPIVPLFVATRLFHKLPELESLSIPCSVPNTDATPSEIQSWKRVRVKSLRTLVLQDTSQIEAMLLLPPGAFPNLRWLNLDSPYHCLSDFVSMHGQSLTALGCRSEPMLMKHLAMSASSMISEIHVTLNSDEQYGVRPSGPSQPWVSTLGIHISSPFFTSKSDSSPVIPSGCARVRDIHFIIGWSWTYIFPGLKTIRVMEHVDVKLYQLHNHVSQFYFDTLGRWVKYPIRVEDIGGRFLAEISPGIGAIVGAPRRRWSKCCSH